MRFLAASAALALWLAAASGAAEPPPSGTCPGGAGAGAANAEDGSGPLFSEGDVLAFGDLPSLKRLLPDELWTYRDAFFYEGMRMEIGWCHRRYAPGKAYAEATEKFRGQTQLDEKGNLRGYRAGVPFPSETIDLRDPTAGVRWAWNLQHRYRGAGAVGSFRLIDLPDGRGFKGSPLVYTGSFFYLKTGHRADLAASGYQEPEAKNALWVAGGRFEEPFDARRLAWRQIRPSDTETDFSEVDDTFVYVPENRKMRRAATPWVDGLYMPRYRVMGNQGAAPTPYAQGGGDYGTGLSAIETNATLSLAVTEAIERGLTGLALRPNAYRWTVRGTREVLAPLNGNSVGWPLNPDRNYGPYGLSVASDRWDVREAVVIEGEALRQFGNVARVTFWIDTQTQQPLYVITRRKDGLLLDVGILVHTYSGDRPDYPAWPTGDPANVFDPVAAAFYYAAGGGSGWLRESYDVRSLPLDPKELRQLTSTDSLLRGR